MLHSALSERERFDAWQACARGEIDVVVGARSAVFAPLPNVGLLVVDEAHETSYKQDTCRATTRSRSRANACGARTACWCSAARRRRSRATPRRSAGRIALLCCASARRALPLPACASSTWRRVRRRQPAHFQHRARRGARRTAGARREERAVRQPARQRGFVLCRSCGYVPQCERCSVSLARTAAKGCCAATTATAQRAIPRAVRRAARGPIREFGVGTRARRRRGRARCFPQARVRAHGLRHDDARRRPRAHPRQFEERGDVLVGTQMVAKGLDFPTVTLVGVVAADVGLHVPDFRAAERSFALIAQVCGRSGRAAPGEAIVQTYSPEHPAIVFAAEHDYEGFADARAAERRELALSAVRRLVYLGVIGRGRKRAAAEAAARTRGSCARRRGEVLGPAPYPDCAREQRWRFRIAIETRTPKPLRAAIRSKVLPAAQAERAARFSNQC